MIPSMVLILAGLAVTRAWVGCLTRAAQRPERRLPVRGQLPDAADRSIRVRLCGRRGAGSFSLAVHAPFVIEEERTGEVLDDVSAAMREQIVTVAPDVPTGIHIGKWVFATDRLRIVPASDAALVVDGRTYRGTLTVRRAGDRVVVTNVLDVESYLAGVLAGELPRSFHRESFAALAVAARTYVLYQKQTYGRRRDFDVLPDERSQMYLGLAGEHPIAVSAVRRTCGQVCTLSDADGGGLFCTYYSSCCGGMSQPVRNVKPHDPDVAPLAGGVSCDDCRDAPYYHWDPVRVGKDELTRRLVQRYPSLERLGRLESFQPVVTTDDGRFVKIKITGQSGRSDFLIGEDFRLAVGGRTIKSTRCRLYDDGDEIVFYDGRGYGHGLGLCQYGADGLARRGDTYREILAHYYPGSVIRTLYECP